MQKEERNFWREIYSVMLTIIYIIKNYIYKTIPLLLLFLCFYSDTVRGEFLKSNIWLLNRWFYDGVLHSHLTQAIYSHWLIYLVEAAHAFYNSSLPLIAHVQHGAMKVWIENCFLVSLSGKKGYIGQMIWKFKPGYTCSVLVCDNWVALVTN